MNEDYTSADYKELQQSPVQEDIKTSELQPRLAEDGSHIREYSPVLHDKEVRETPAMTADSGRRFGTNVLPEALSMSLDNARAWLAMVYGYDRAGAMLMEALTRGGVVNGGKFKVADSQAKTTGKITVTSDKSRPGEFVIAAHILRQSGGKKT